MKKITITVTVAAMALLLLTSAAQAKKATSDEALAVARNWVSLILEREGNWGGSPTAHVMGVQEFRRGKRVLGYFCRVEPVGYVVISLHKELAAVKASSDTHDLDPASDEGMADLIKGGLERMMRAVERKTGKKIDDARDEDVAGAVEIDYSDAWVELQVISPQVNYESGTRMLTSSWHQGDPYNRWCPAGPTCTHTLVGCVATAGAQVMRHWNWPPFGVGAPYSDTYDWVNMPDRATSSSTQAQIDAVAELCREVGQAVNMQYGCDESSAYTANMEGVYENQFRYDTSCTISNRSGYTAQNWFNLLVFEFNRNRPVQYRIPGHSIVGDGWRTIGSTNQYHMNYGWDSGHNTWYTVDALPGGEPNDEFVVRSIRPAVAVGSALAGNYTLQAFPYRYFDVDADGSSATFNSGQYIQFLSNVRVMCNSTTGGSIRFYGASGLWTRLYTRGNPVRGIRIDNGAIKLNQNGGLILRT